MIPMHFNKPARITIHVPRGDGEESVYYEFAGYCSASKQTDTIDVSSFDSPLKQYVSGYTNIQIDVRCCEPVIRNTLAETMALAVLRSDMAAARALADLLVEEVARQSVENPPPTYDELNARLRLLNNHNNQTRTAPAHIPTIHDDADWDWEIEE